DAADLDIWSQAHAGEFELFLHAFDGTPVEQRLLAAAARASVGNSELYRDLRAARPDVQELFCPGTIRTPTRFQRTDDSVFPVNQAHKPRLRLSRRLREPLGATGKSYSV